MFARKLLFSVRMLVAAAAITALVSPAQAALSLSVTATPPGTAASSATFSSPTGSGSVGGFSFSYNLSSMMSGGSNTVSMTISSLSGTSTNGSGNLTFAVQETGYTQPIGVSTLSANLQGQLTGNIGTTVRGQYNNGPTTVTSTPLGIGGSGSVNLTSGPTQLVAVSGYNLTNITSLNYSSTQALGGTFSATTTLVPVPEPAGVVAGLMGLPCMGGLLAVARRRLFGATDVIA